MKHAIRLIILLFVLLNITALCQVYDWRGPDRSGIYSQKGLLKKWPPSGPELLWEKEEIGFGYSSPTVANNTVYVTGRKGDNDVLTALSLDGKEKSGALFMVKPGLETLMEQDQHLLWLVTKSFLLVVEVILFVWIPRVK